MPPLLPEYLNQPFEVIVLSTPMAWWEPAAALVGPMSGLLGVVAGAFITHKLGKSQERKRLKLEKLQEFTTLSRKLRENSAKSIEKFKSAVVYEGECCHIDVQRLPGPDELNDDIKALEFLVKVHCPELHEQCQLFVNTVIQLNTKIHLRPFSGTVDSNCFEKLFVSIFSLSHEINSWHILLENKAIEKARRLY